jgi:hypothetical protein
MRTLIAAAESGGRTEGVDVVIRNRHLRRWLAASLIAAAVAVPAAQAEGPDDRALYRGGDPALTASQSPDDRPLYRGSSDRAAAGLSPDDRPFSRGARGIEPGTVRVETTVTPPGFDWGDAAIGGAFVLALSLVVAAAALMATHRRLEADGRQV